MFWGGPPTGSSRLVATVHELRRRPLAELGVEDLRVLIGQQVGLPVLVPRAVRVLEADPLAEGDFYPGDLLVAVIRVPAAYWVTDRDSRARLEAVLATVEPGEVDDETRAEINKFGRAEG
ncbi:contact-dependent growth inhibition system immunity protein [Actinoplanes sp. NBC_00393]